MKHTTIYKLLFSAGLGMLAGSAQAQYGNNALPKIITYKPGVYQLQDGSWRAGQLYADAGEHLRVRNPDDKKITEYQPNEVQTFVLALDTFRVVRGVDISARRRLSSAFARQLYRAGSFTVFELEHSVPGAVGVLALGVTEQYSLVVQPRTGDGVRVPATRGAFEKAMLPLVGDCPELATKIKAGKLGKQHLREILTTYIQWERTKSQPTGQQ
ncbi:hypothetical protein FY528_16530 [Hymenobacter lutimineralis]|uniref:Uncharacterized protein n=1 Tax=Hymenobacter lutimineralis TaxID=2606448 RepID=A0A5D6UUV3_9BACT|nr:MULTISPECIES: hypothetical protein [Hymenobacter]QIX62338.1 hypothetical protein HER32_14580 [Hymenobacter sp. BT18]TYZ06880.1 hypothetical protein FY528_16530 [Hymenobacter lutimineralis]